MPAYSRVALLYNCVSGSSVCTPNVFNFLRAACDLAFSLLDALGTMESSYLGHKRF